MDGLGGYNIIKKKRKKVRGKNTHDKRKSNDPTKNISVRASDLIYTVRYSHQAKGPTS